MKPRVHHTEILFYVCCCCCCCCCYHLRSVVAAAESERNRVPLLYRHFAAAYGRVIHAELNVIFSILPAALLPRSANCVSVFLYVYLSFLLLVFWCSFFILSVFDSILMWKCAFHFDWSDIKSPIYAPITSSMLYNYHIVIKWMRHFPKQ